ncbi:hypothetical protein Acr_19g0007640 [Actinidia rufa]|uniref:Uncharacterized protein n=1 Tax=Actinidia rufa TaxID=165716 RepID=A0A7J0GAJ5_9ERIC|nr:hypothetical protein Acr_19g0007640 [Actinidia rufa]
MADLESLRRLKSAEPPLYLSPSADLSQDAREASQNMFSFLKPFAPKSPFDRLLVDGFDAEQIWQQIDLQSQPLISNLRRQLKKFEKNPEEIAKVFGQNEKKERQKEDGLEKEELDGVEDEDLEGFDDEDKDEESGEEELEEYLEGDEAREYGLKKKGDERLSNEDEEEEEEEEDEEGDELGLFGADTDGDGANELESARYEDFFGSKKKNYQKRKPKFIDASDDLSSDEDIDDKAFDNQKQNLSTHEKHLEKLQAKIEQMEQANLEPKTWTMQGEVTAAKRPKDSALEVDLDFEHNVRPAPVITEEVTASLEDLIQKRILEVNFISVHPLICNFLMSGHFDDVRKIPDLPSKAPRELKELDENKSKKGLAEIYEDEYVQKTGLVSAALSFSDEQKKEASMLFKKLCLKLDALSHFHFTPKPVVEDMAIQANVPALAMEEIAPLAVSDAAMLAPEEVFAGKGDIKEETELTQADRKRRRANKKRKFKGCLITNLANLAAIWSVVLE